MKLCYKWLNEFVDLEGISPYELAELLTMKTCEVEGVEEPFAHLNKFPVVEVKSLKAHPNADKLKICEVQLADKSLSVVTGAPNVKEGKKYPLAPAGSVLPGGKKIENALLRGVASEGMLLSAEELQLKDFMWASADNLTGILELPEESIVGHSVAQALHLQDTILEIDNKSITHRGDLWSHYGFAREIAALLSRPLKKDPLEEVNLLVTNEDKLEVIIDTGAVAYYGMVFSVTNLPITPLLIQSRLILCGMRPVNFWVDLSNYVMLEVGQPTHAFDRKKLQGPIRVAYAQPGDSLILLDGRKINLSENILLIKDGERPLALAGVMGGKESETSLETKTIFLESATFLRPEIRRSLRETLIRSEASQRFEKGLSPVLAKKALYRYYALVKQFVPNCLAGPLSQVELATALQNKIHTKVSYIRQRLGLEELSLSKIQQVLGSLGMKVLAHDDDLTVEVPDYRSYYDITIPEDLVEEIGRLIGYKEIRPVPFMVACTVPTKANHLRRMEHELRKLFAWRYHFSEVYNYHFCTANELELDKRYSEKALFLLNPLQAEQKYLRTSPLVMLLRNVASHYKEFSELRFFEIERIFLPRQEELPQERLFLSAIETTREPVKDLKQMISLCHDLLKKMGVYHFEQRALKQNIFHPTRALELISEQKSLIRLGQLHPAILDQWKIPLPVLYLEFFLEDLLRYYLKGEVRYVRLPRYPASDFEITIIAPRRTPVAQILKTMGEVESPPEEDRTYIEDIRFLYTYEGPPIASDKKAVSLRITWRNPTRTLKSDEIKNLQEELVEKMAKAGFPLRS
ncbi:MAG: phenylalanine--tRNA ligase subunit beta [Leptospiraceae bacterium]|nr:phenylalanine--tRNA ligase subunit beta [Leptospiraceae bacterium]MDW8306750.1 phenylalanine--tRNA ligase subunit beta [Leptospiraceae bacterium]